MEPTASWVVPSPEQHLVPVVEEAMMNQSTEEPAAAFPDIPHAEPVDGAHPRSAMPSFFSLANGTLPKQHIRIAVLVLLLLVATTVVVVLQATSNKNESNITKEVSQGNGGENPKNNPTMSPTISPLPPPTSLPTIHMHLGTYVDGEAAYEWFGWDVSLSANGTRVAIGARLNDRKGSAGTVRIYDLSSGGSLVQMGSDLDGEAIEDQSGYSVALSSNGNRVAIGAPGSFFNCSIAGHVHIYDWDGSQWGQMGSDLDGLPMGDVSGNTIALSSDGNRVAIGGPFSMMIMATVIALVVSAFMTGPGVDGSKWVPTWMLLHYWRMTILDSTLPFLRMAVSWPLVGAGIVSASMNGWKPNGTNWVLTWVARLLKIG